MVHVSVTTMFCLYNILYCQQAIYSKLQCLSIIFHFIVQL